MTDPGQAGDPAEPVLAGTIDRAIAAYRRLAELGEQIADEWQYVNDLVAVYTAELASLATTPLRPASQAAAARAIDAALEEIALIADPHRAIDWLSTFPQVVRLAVVPPSFPERPG